MTNYTNNPMYDTLLKACRADPTDDLARLVLADWLELEADISVNKLLCLAHSGG